MTEYHPDVVIVGAGMVGMALARALGMSGLKVGVIDRQAPAAAVLPHFDGRVTAIAFGPGGLLRQIGVFDRIAAAAEPIREIRVVDGDSPLLLHFDHREVGNAPFGHIVENRHLRLALQQAVAATPAVTLMAPASIRAMARGPAGITLDLAGGERLRARLVVGADGRQSWVRRQGRIGATEWTYHHAAIVCTVTHERPHRGVAVERFLPAGPFAILPMTGNRSSLVWTERPALAPALVALADAAFAAEVAWRFGDYLGAVAPIGGRWTYPLALTHATAYVAERLALIGDAAHAIHPIAGQGFNLGLRDAAALAEILVDGHRLGLDPGAAHGLARYQRWRRADALLMIAATDGLNRLFTVDAAPVRLARQAGLALVNRLPPLKRLFMRHAMGLAGDLPRTLRGLPL